MSYQALYRVWRPQLFADVVGQSHITRTLQNAIVQNKFSHAYLFSGPRGTGKTSAAKIFAKTVNCKQAPIKEPCGQCEACIGIQTGAISDVMEIDAASNNGVEQIRDIRDKVKYAPSAVSYKVYIIDEVHMLSIGAFNALLKTLEEPPKHVIFILATTEPHKIPLTIISRCQRFDFKRITQKSLVDRMKTIMESEDITVAPEAYDAVALAAEGGMRDALSLLDQAISYSEGEVRLEDVLSITGSVSQDNLSKLIAALLEDDVQATLSLIDRFIQEGKDPGRLVHDLIYFLRDLLLYKSAPNLSEVLERAVANDSFRTLADQVTAPWIQQAIMELNKCQQEMKWTNSPKVFIEITMLKITEQPRATEEVNVPDNDQILQLKQKIGTLEKDLQALKTNGSLQSSESQQQDKTKRRQSPVKKSFKVSYDKIRKALDEATKDDLKQVQAQWATFMQQLKQQNAPAHATLQNAKPSAASNEVIVIAFKYEIHCSLAQEHQSIIESILQQLMGREMKFIPIPESDWLEIRQEYVQKQRQQGDEKTGTKEDPIIEEARKLVGDDLLEIHED